MYKGELPFHCFCNIREYTLKYNLTHKSNFLMLLLCAVGRAKFDVVHPRATSACHIETSLYSQGKNKPSTLLGYSIV
jgi:hypothetical protein